VFSTATFLTESFITSVAGVSDFTVSIGEIVSEIVSCGVSETGETVKFDVGG
jgi:hypothetical protein